MPSFLVYQYKYNSACDRNKGHDPGRAIRQPASETNTVVYMSIPVQSREPKKRPCINQVDVVDSNDRIQQRTCADSGESTKEETNFARARVRSRACGNRTCHVSPRTIITLLPPFYPKYSARDFASQALSFLACNIRNWEWPGDEATVYYCKHVNRMQQWDGKGKYPSYSNKVTDENQ